MRILIECPTCLHTVSIEASGASLTVFRVAPSRRQLAARLSFVCPDCGADGDVGVPPGQELRLAQAAVPVEVVDDPRERHPSALGRRPGPHGAGGHGAALDAPPFTESDVASLRRLLDRDDWFERFLDAT